MEPRRKAEIRVELAVPEKVDLTASGEKVMLGYRLEVEGRVGGCVNDSPIVEAEVSIVDGHSKHNENEIQEIQGFHPHIVQ